MTARKHPVETDLPRSELAQAAAALWPQTEGPHFHQRLRLASCALKIPKYQFWNILWRNKIDPTIPPPRTYW